MDRRRAVTGLFVVAVVVVFAPVVGTTAYHDEEVSVSPRGDEFVTATAVEQGAEGHWWVLERSLESGGGAVYEYTDAWEPTESRHKITRPRRSGPPGSGPIDLAQSPNGTWYVLRTENRVSVFTDDWEYTGRTIRLPSRSGFDVETREAHAFERTAVGWWVDAYGRLTLYDHDFTRILASYDGYHGLDLGSEYYNDYLGVMQVGDVRALEVTPDGTLWLRASLGSETYRFETAGESGLASTTPTAAFEPEANPPDASSVAAGPEGRLYVLEGDGRLSAYTSRWVFTGTVRTVGSGDAVDGYPSHHLTLGIEPLISAGIKLLPLVCICLLAVVSTRIREHPDDAEAVYTAALVSAVVSYALFYEPAPLRPLATTHPAVLGGTLIGIACAIGYYADTERARIPTLPLLFGPVLFKIVTIGARLLG